MQPLYRYILLPTVSFSNVRFLNWLVEARLVLKFHSALDGCYSESPRRAAVDYSSFTFRGDCRNICTVGWNAKQFLLSVAFNEAVSCLDYLASVTHEWRNLEYVLSDAARGKSKCWEKD